MYELRIIRERRSSYGDLKKLEASKDVFETFRHVFEDSDREKFVVVPVDAKHRVLGYSVVAIGSLTAALVHPREVLKVVILANAAAFLILHNHPSGDPAASPEDRQITRRIREASELLGIRLLDHVIFGTESFYSFVERGVM